MTYSISFEIQGLPKMSNQLLRGHWQWRAKHAKEWKGMTHLQLLINGGPPPRPLTSAILTLTRVSSNEPDYDGLVSSFKHIVDSLVENGVLASDKASCIGQPIYKWEKGLKNKGKVKITVTERAKEQTA